MRFVLDEYQNFFSFAHFRAAILVSSSRFGAAFYCFNFAFCSTTYVRPLSHLSLLGFVPYVFFTLPSSDIPEIHGRCALMCFLAAMVTGSAARVKLQL